MKYAVKNMLVSDFLHLLHTVLLAVVDTTAALYCTLCRYFPGQVK